MDNWAQQNGFDAPAFTDTITQPSPQAPQTIQTMKKKSGLASWLPTIGSIAAPALGALLAPETGGLSLLAGAALSGAGSAAGKVGENAIEHNNLTSGLAGEGVQGALGGALGFGLGKFGGKALGVAKNYGDNLLSQVGGTVSKNVARALDAKGTTQIMSNYGINPADHASIASQVTGQNGLLNKLVSKAVGQAGPVDTTGVDNMASDLVGQDTRLGDTASQKALNFINQGLSKLNKVENTTTAPLTKATAAGTSDILNSGANPNDTLDFIRSLQSKASGLVGNGKSGLTINDESKGVADVYRQVARELEDRLYSGAGADNAVVDGLVGPDEVKQLMDISPGNKKWGGFVQQVMNAQNVGDLRSLQAPFVKASQLATEKGINAATKGATGNWVKAGLGAAGVAASPFTGGASLAVPAAEAVLGTDTGKTIFGNLLRGAADKTATASGSKAGQVFGNTVPQLITHAPDFTNPQSAMPDTSNNRPGLLDNPDIQQKLQSFSNTNDLANASSDTSGPGLTGYTDDELTGGISKAIQAGDIKSATEIQNLLKLNQSGAKQNKISAVQQRNLAAVNSGLDGIQQVAKLWESLGIGGGPGGIIKGKLQAAGARLGIQDSAKAYNDQRSELAISIARAINMGTGQSNNMTSTAVEKALPNTTDTHGSAVRKLNNLMDRLLSAQKEIVSVPQYAGDNMQNANDYTGAGFSPQPSQVQFAQ